MKRKERPNGSGRGPSSAAAGGAAAAATTAGGGAEAVGGGGGGAGGAASTAAAAAGGGSGAGAAAAAPAHSSLAAAGASSSSPSSSSSASAVAAVMAEAQPEHRSVCLSRGHKAQGLLLSAEDQLTVWTTHLDAAETGSSASAAAAGGTDATELYGYGTVCASMGVSKGCYYWEAEVLAGRQKTARRGQKRRRTAPQEAAAAADAELVGEQEEEEEGESEGHVRLGWATSGARLNAPLGCDAEGYAFRDRSGSIVHAAVRNDGYLREGMSGFGVGDVVGAMLYLPLSIGAATAAATISASTGTAAGATAAVAAPSAAQPSAGAVPWIRFFVNGVDQGIAFEGHAHFPQQSLHGAATEMFFPAVSLYRRARVRVGFGPAFICPPPAVVDGIQVHPISDLKKLPSIEARVEQERRIRDRQRARRMRPNPYSRVVRNAATFGGHTIHLSDDEDGGGAGIGSGGSGGGQVLLKMRDKKL